LVTLRLYRGGVQAFVKHLTHDDYFISRSCCLGGHSRGYKRHGTWTPFAAFEVAIGKVTVAHKKCRRLVGMVEGDRERRRKAGLPDEVEFKTKPQPCGPVTSGVNFTENHRFEFPHFAENVDLRRIGAGCAHFSAPLNLPPHAHSIAALGDRAWPGDSPL
jgi:hypothetical protein